MIHPRAQKLKLSGYQLDPFDVTLLQSKGIKITKETNFIQLFNALPPSIEYKNNEYNLHMRYLTPDDEKEQKDETVEEWVFKYKDINDEHILRTGYDNSTIAYWVGKTFLLAIIHMLRYLLDEKLVTPEEINSRLDLSEKQNYNND